MSKLRGPAAALLARLPVQYRSRASAVFVTLGVIVSALSVSLADRPEIALAVQALTALGVVAPVGKDEPEE
jgi:hypothetical protein